MDYQKAYDNLISRSIGRKLEGYYEKHHIIPKCLGGSDDTMNLVSLTPEEHYVAHQLLVKLYPGNTSLVYAVHMMGSTRKGNKVYGWLRRLHQEACTGVIKSEETRQKISNALTGKKKSDKAKKNMSIAKQNYVPWNKNLKTGITTNGCFQKGNIPWNAGISHPCKDGAREKISEANKNRKRVYNEDGSWKMIKVE